MLIQKSSRETDAELDAGKPDVCTSENDKITERYIRSCGAIPTLKVYGEDPGAAVKAALEIPNLNNDDVGHGIGKMQKAPQIPNAGLGSHVPRLQSGLTLAQPQIGQVVESITGRDISTRYLIVKIQGNMLFASDGRKRKIVNPKKKNIRHVSVYKQVFEEIAKRIQADRKVTDEEIRSALKSSDADRHREGRNSCPNKT